MPTTSVQLPPRKRRKTQLACNPCRARKSGCDGARPVCSSCTSKGWQQRCTYQESVLHASSTPSISQLSKRLERLEELPAAQARDGLPHPDPRPETDISGGAHDVFPLTTNGLTTPIGNITPQPPAQLSATNALQSASPLSRNEADGDAMYGPSSNSSFLRLVTEAAGPRSSNTKSPEELAGQDAVEATPTVLGFAITTQPKSPDILPDPVMLPERWLADNLFRCFWDFVHPVFPILHRPSFTASYEAVWQPSQGRPPNRDYKDIVFHATLSIVLALGCQRTDQVSVTEQVRLANRFYKQSCKLVSVDTLDHSSLQIVQLLLLRGVYLHYTQYADRCWNTVGVALRVAQGLGLHSRGDGSMSSNSQLKREMRRRVWHCCLTLDRLTATTFGRPVLVSRQYSVPPPEPIDDEYLSESSEGLQPSDRPSYLAFFVHSVALFDVLNEILARFYTEGESVSDKTPDSLSHVLQLSSKLDELGHSFPPYLREGADLTQLDEELRGCLQMQANILKSRVLWIRLLLLRPLLLAEAKHGSRPEKPFATDATHTLRDSLGHSANLLCVSTAHSVLQELHEKLGSVRQNSAWHVLLFTFAAASTLVVATLCPDFHVSFETEPTKSSWNRALRIFDFHKQHVASASRGIEVLEKFRASVMAAASQRDAPGGAPATNEPYDARLGQGSEQDVLLPFGSVPGTNQTSLAQDFGDFSGSDLLNESWFNIQGIDLANWGIFQ
ncbi:transcriptional regulatory protein [Colletotrichum scovillei]|nr:transcriptional regulatory protein [Colletotrichum scovillei]